eukprot:m51a1_g12540 hypothetical protein (320) ;mRNA; r:49-1066
MAGQRPPLLAVLEAAIAASCAVALLLALSPPQAPAVPSPPPAAAAAHVASPSPPPPAEQQEEGEQEGERRRGNTYTARDIVCGVITTRKYHATRAAAVKRTWGPRCGALVFVSADADAALPTVAFAGTEEGPIINKKVLRMFEHVWERYGGNHSWFLKADDDTYVDVDALAAALSRYDHRRPLYVGRAGEWRGVEYCGGGAGYVLSHRLLSLWAPRIGGCEQLPVGEDVSVGKCLRQLGVRPTWLTGFYHQTPAFFLATAQGARDHPEGLTPRPLTFHSVEPSEMLALDYLLHDVRAPAAAWRGTRWESDPWPPSHPTH